MLEHELNDLITLTGQGTPMGGLMRRYWLPALLSEEIPEPDSPPVQVRLLGEELVAFRDSQGRIGLLEEHCSHRGTSLFYGHNEACGLRCIYHGWKYDVEGNVLDTPAEPGISTFKDKVHHPAYPTVEAGGMIWAYLGPREKQPPFPHYNWMDVPLSHTYVTKCLLEANYLQGLEGECDSAHLSFLHSELDDQGRRALYMQDRAPKYELEDTDFGMRMIALRNTVDGQTYVRVSSFVMPVTCWIYANAKEVHMYVPADDTHAWRWDFGFFMDREARPEDSFRAPEIEANYIRRATARNHYLQDREAQRTSDFTGIPNFLNEDCCATETMGPRYDRGREHLGQSDRAVIAARRHLVEAARAFECGGDPPNVSLGGEGQLLSHIDTLAEVIPAGVHWREAFPHLTVEAPAPVTAGR